MLTRIGAWAKGWADANEPWTNVYGLARSLLALATLATLVATPPSALFHPVSGVTEVPYCSDALTSMGLFCAGRLAWTRWIAVAVLLVVASGWRPRWTALPHWWVTASFAVNASLVEGGDQLAAALALFLVPVALTDRRKWHWDPAPARASSPREDAMRVVACVGYALVRVQVAVVYFHAAVGKMAVPEWQDGTVLYYWMLHPTFGAPEWLRGAVRAALLNGTFVALLTWSVIALEYLLSAALFMPKRRWRYLLAGGLALHAGIVAIHGLVSFGLVMFAALVLYLRPWERSFLLLTTKNEKSEQNHETNFGHRDDARILRVASTRL